MSVMAVLPWEFWGSIVSIVVVTGAIIFEFLRFRQMSKSSEQALAMMSSRSTAHNRDLHIEMENDAGKKPVPQALDALDEARLEALSWFEHQSCLQGLLGGFALPISSLTVMMQRGGYSKKLAWFASSAALATISVILSAVMILHADYAMALLMLSMLILTCMLLHVVQVTGTDSEMQEIDSFMEHRVAKCTSKNMLGVITLVASVFQLGGLAAKLFIKPTADSSETIDKVKATLMSVCQYSLIEFESIAVYLEVDDIKLYRTYFKYAQIGAAVLAVTVFCLLYSALLYRVVHLAEPQLIDADADQSRLGLTMVGKASGAKKARMAVYSKMKESSMYTTMFQILSDTLVVVVVNGLLQVLSCTADSNGILMWTADDLTPCFVGRHAWYSVIAVALVIYYSVSVVLTAPFVMADSDGIFSGPELDLRYVPKFYAHERLAKCALTFANILFKQQSCILRNLNYIVNVWLAYLVTTTRPCSVMWVNAARAAVYQTSALVALFVILDDIFLGAWWILFVLPLLLALVMARCVMEMCSAMSVPQFMYTKSIGLEYFKDNAKEFSDVSMLRGSFHKIAAVRVWYNMYQGRKGVNGLEAIYQIDGATLRAPARLSTWFAYGNSTMDITLDHDEFFIAMTHDASARTGNKRMMCYGLATNKGKRYKLGDQDVELPDDLSEWTVQAAPGEVVGFSGATNGRLQRLFFILQKQSSME